MWLLFVQPKGFYYWYIRKTVLTIMLNASWKVHSGELPFCFLKKISHTKHTALLPAPANDSPSRGEIATKLWWCLQWKPQEESLLPLRQRMPFLSVVPLWPFCTRIALLLCRMLLDMREFGAQTALEGDLGRPETCLHMPMGVNEKMALHSKITRQYRSIKYYTNTILQFKYVYIYIPEHMIYRINVERFEEIWIRSEAFVRTGKMPMECENSMWQFSTSKIRGLTSPE